MFVIKDDQIIFNHLVELDQVTFFHAHHRVHSLLLCPILDISLDCCFNAFITQFNSE